MSLFWSQCSDPKLAPTEISIFMWSLCSQIQSVCCPCWLADSFQRINLSAEMRSALNDNFCERNEKNNNISWWLCLLSAASCEEWSLMLFPASVSSVWKGEKQYRRIQENNTLTLGLYETQCEHSQTLLLISVVSCVLHFSYSSAQLHTHHWHPALWYQVS